MTYDLIVIGAGPAGMAAACVAAAHGARVLVLDQQAAPGGQIYRNAATHSGSADWLGQDYAAGAPLISRFAKAGITAQYSARVWRLENGPAVVWSQNGVSHLSRARQVLLATGAQERPMPFPGWTLPGVMSAGGAQILMKSAGMVPKDAVLAGSGPLLYLVAAQMIAAGHPPSALVETQTPNAIMRALRHVPRALLALPTLAKGIGLIAKIRAAGVPRYTASSDFEACATPNGALEFCFSHAGKRISLTCETLLTHQGVIPATHISRSVGIRHAWCPVQQSLQPITNRWGATDRHGLHMAGDGAGILGADAARALGELAALDIVHRLGKITADARNQLAAAPQAQVTVARAIRPFLDVLYAPPAENSAPRPTTIVCRCEGITAAQLQANIAAGTSGLRRTKTDLRVGMGPCQGRMCEATVQAILHKSPHDPAATRTAPRARSPIVPIALGEIAALQIKQDPEP